MGARLTQVASSPKSYSPAPAPSYTPSPSPIRSTPSYSAPVTPTYSSNEKDETIKLLNKVADSKEETIRLIRICIVLFLFMFSILSLVIFIL